jgi:hypothetical protein
MIKVDNYKYDYFHNERKYMYKTDHFQIDVLHVYNKP